MVAAIVGIRKAMDYFPNIFTQRELSWLDDVIPDEQKERFNGYSHVGDNVMLVTLAECWRQL